MKIGAVVQIDQIALHLRELSSDGTVLYVGMSILAEPAEATDSSLSAASLPLE
jgi:cell volume regulation protein A